MTVWVHLFRPMRWHVIQSVFLRLSLQLNSIQFNSMQFNAVQCNWVPLKSIPFNSIQFRSIPFQSIPFHSNSTQLHSIRYSIQRFSTPAHAIFNSVRPSSGSGITLIWGKRNSVTGRQTQMLRFDMDWVESNRVELSSVEWDQRFDD